jgi:hypothetical protein
LFLGLAARFDAVAKVEGGAEVEVIEVEGPAEVVKVGEVEGPAAEVGVANCGAGVGDSAAGG